MLIINLNVHMAYYVLTLIVSKKETMNIIKELKKIKMDAFIIGDIIDTNSKPLVKYINI